MLVGDPLLVSNLISSSEYKIVKCIIVNLHKMACLLWRRMDEPDYI